MKIVSILFNFIARNSNSVYDEIAISIIIGVVFGIVFGVTAGLIQLYITPLFN